VLLNHAPNRGRSLSTVDKFSNVICKVIANGFKIICKSHLAKCYCNSASAYSASAKADATRLHEHRRHLANVVAIP